MSDMIARLNAWQEARRPNIDPTSVDHLIHGLMEVRYAFDMMRVALPELQFSWHDGMVLRANLLSHPLMDYASQDVSSNAKIMGFDLNWPTPSSSPPPAAETPAPKAASAQEPQARQT